MKRGEVWTVSRGPDYASKPRPAVIVQDTSVFPATGSVTICPITTTHVEVPLTRVAIDPGRDNGLHTRSEVMVDKMTTVTKSKLGKRVGRLTGDQMERVKQAVLVFLGLTTMLVLSAVPLAAQDPIKASLPPITPAWTKGIQAINQENYWNAVSCGKQGGQRPLCVFYEAELCKNPDFEIAMFTPYKMVAYEVWNAVRAKQPAPTPSYAEAQRTRISVKLTPKAAAKNAVTGFQIKRDGKTIAPLSKSLDAGVGTFIFDFAPFAPTADITFEMIGKARTVSCVIDTATLSQMR